MVNVEVLKKDEMGITQDQGGRVAHNKKLIGDAFVDSLHIKKGSRIFSWTFFYENGYKATIGMLSIS